MIPWIRDGVLMLVILVGMFSAWRTGTVRSELRKEEQRLALWVGPFEQLDPDRVHIRALKTNDPLHFAWRVQIPANYPIVLTSNRGDRSSGSASSVQHFIARVRFRECPDGDLAVYTSFGSGASLMQMGQPGLANLLRDRWQECSVAQAGATETFSMDALDHTTLLTLTMPRDVEEQARKQLPPFAQKQFVPNFFSWELGN